MERLSCRFNRCTRNNENIWTRDGTVIRICPKRTGSDAVEFSERFIQHNYTINRLFSRYEFEGTIVMVIGRNRFEILRRLFTLWNGDTRGIECLRFYNRMQMFFFSGTCCITRIGILCPLMVSSLHSVRWESLQDKCTRGNKEYLSCCKTIDIYHIGKKAYSLISIGEKKVSIILDSQRK